MRDQKVPIFIYDPKRIGSHVHEVGMQVLGVQGQEIISRWFRDGDQTEIFLWQDQRQNIIKQQIIVFGQVAEWNIVEGLKTGFLVEESIDPETRDHREEVGAAGKEFSTIHFDGQVQAGAIQVAVEILEWASGLPTRERRAMIENFRTSPTMDQIDPVILFQRFGHKPPSFLKKIMWRLKRLLR